MKYKAFISYKHTKSTQKKVEALEKALKEYAKPLLKPSIRIFRDTKEMLPGDDLSSTINNALQNSEYFILIASKEAVESKWVQNEIRTWCGDLGKSDKLIIVQVNGEILTDAETEQIVWEKTNALPSLLEEYIASIPVFIDLTVLEKDEELDLNNIGFRDAINSIIARFRGKTPSEMNDNQVLTDRRNKRIKNGLAVIFTILFMSLAITSWIAVNEKKRADKQYKEAVITGLAAKSQLVLPTNNIKAIRIAEAAYKISMPNPPPDVIWALNSAAMSSLERPFYQLKIKHGNNMRFAKFSPGGQMILTVSDEHTAKLWNRNGTFIADLKHKSSISSAVFSPDGTQILTTSEEQPAKLWNLKGTLITDFNPKLPIDNAVFSPDGTKVLTFAHGWQRRDTWLWDLKGNLIYKMPEMVDVIFSPDSKTLLVYPFECSPELRNFSGDELALFDHGEAVSQTFFSPDGTRVVTFPLGGKTVKLWDLHGRFLTVFKHTTPLLEQYIYDVRHAFFSPGGEKILTVASDNKMSDMKLWSTSGRQIAGYPLFKRLVSAAFSPDGNRILTTSDDGSVILWDLKGARILDIPHTRGIKSAEFSPCGGRLLIALSDNFVELWNLKGKRLTAIPHAAPVNSATFSPDGDRILTASADGFATLWDLKNPLVISLKHEKNIESIMFSKSGTRILSASSDGIARIWGLDGSLEKEFKHNGRDVNTAVFSPDETKILTASNDYTAKLWDSEGKQLMVLAGHKENVESAVFSPNGKFILTASDDDTAMLWNLKGKCLAVFRHKYDVNSAVFSPDGNMIVTASDDARAKLWNLSGRQLAVFRHLTTVNSAVFSPGGGKILTASRDKTAVLWDLKGTRLRKFQHEADVKCADFSPSGTMVLTASEDETAKIWNLNGDSMPLTILHQDGIDSGMFSPDGKRVLTASSDNTARLWDLNGNLLAVYQLNDDVRLAVFSPSGRRILTVSLDKTVNIYPSTDTLMEWLVTAPILKLSKEDEVELGISRLSNGISCNVGKLNRSSPPRLMKTKHRNRSYEKPKVSPVYSPPGKNKGEM